MILLACILRWPDVLRGLRRGLAKHHYFDHGYSYRVSRNPDGTETWRIRFRESFWEAA